MRELTKRQRQVLDFIQKSQHGGITPSLREIAGHFGFRSPRTASEHVAALRRKGVLSSQAGRARSLRVVSPLHNLRQRVVDIPLYGSIPAGPPQAKEQEAEGCVSIDLATLGIKPSARTFALQVRGDSMIGKHILDGDIVVVEHGQTPRNGDVVAALIDGESTLKTFVSEKGKLQLKAENPRYPRLIPAAELVIQGVVVTLLRKWK